MTTERRCSVSLINSTGHDITNVEFSHTNGYGDWTQRIAALANSASVGPWNVVYKTGIGSNTDHWHVSFVNPNGIALETDRGFDCSPDADEDGKDIRAIITAQKLVIQLTADGCEESLRPRGRGEGLGPIERPRRGDLR